MDASQTELRRTGMLLHLPPDRWEMLSAVPHEIRRFGAREAISLKGEPVERSLLMLGGTMGRYISRPGRDDRQMVALQIAGDFVDLHAFPLGMLDHDVRTITPVTLALFEHRVLREVVERSPDLGIDLWRLTLIDGAIHRHWAFRMGAMRALSRMADFLCEMDLRMRLCGEGEDRGFVLPLTQSDLADACGMTPVHVNRVLRDLREDGCCTLSAGRVAIHDRARLASIAGFDPSFLFVEPDGSGYRSLFEGGFRS